MASKTAPETIDFTKAVLAAIQGFTGILKAQIQNDAEVKAAWNKYGADIESLQSDLNKHKIRPNTAKQRRVIAQATLDSALATATGLQEVAYQNAINAGLAAFQTILNTVLSAALKVSLPF